MTYDEQTVRDVYIRICRDSKFEIDPIESAKLTAATLGIHPLEVAAAFPYISVMCEVGRGEHPSVASTHIGEDT